MFQQVLSVKRLLLVKRTGQNCLNNIPSSIITRECHKASHYLGYPLVCCMYARTWSFNECVQKRKTHIFQALHCRHWSIIITTRVFRLVRGISSPVIKNTTYIQFSEEVTQLCALTQCIKLFYLFKIVMLYNASVYPAGIFIVILIILQVRFSRITS